MLKKRREKKKFRGRKADTGRPGCCPVDLWLSRRSPPPAPVPAPSPFPRCSYAACGILGASSSGTGSDLTGVGVSVSPFHKAILRLAPPVRESVPLTCKFCHSLRAGFIRALYIAYWHSSPARGSARTADRSAGVAGGGRQTGLRFINNMKCFQKIIYIINIIINFNMFRVI